MPGTYTYPGVYVEEIPSGVRTIVGVSTSDTAFVDFFPRGPVDKAVRITSFGDFERVFGGLDGRSEASYALRQYYLNGGAIAWVVRIAASGAQPAAAVVQGGSPLQDTLNVEAASAGAWGNNLQVAAVAIPVPGSPNTFRPDAFNLLVREVRQVNGKQQVVSSESHLNLSMNKTSPRYAVSLVNEESNLVRLGEVGLGELPELALPGSNGAPPEEAFQPLADGSDGSLFNADDGSIADNTAFANAIIGSEAQKTGLHALDGIAPFIFNILCLPATARLDDNGLSAVQAEAIAYCEDKRAFLIVDVPPAVDTQADMLDWIDQHSNLRHKNAAVYFPRIKVPDPLNGNRLRDVPASGAIAGVYARTDASRGVWKAPAGTEAVLRGANLVTPLSDLENGALNPLGVNVLRNFPIISNVIWGARTLEGADQQASEWKYIPVRRLALYLEESLFQGLKWVVFEPNDESLWAQIRLNVGGFMQNLFRLGAFQGKTPREAYFVKCDKETTTQNDINLGIVNIVVGFAPLKPAEFVVLKIQQMAGQVEV